MSGSHYRLVKIVTNFLWSSGYTSAAEGKIAYMDGLRGFAACCVAIHHFCLAFWDCTGIEPPFHPIFRDGGLAVTIFFLLSGRVLMESYVKKPSNHKLYSAFMRRAFRLFLPVFGYLIFWHWLRKYKILALSQYGIRTSNICQTNWFSIYGFPDRPLNLYKDFWDTLAMLLGTQKVIDVPAGGLWTIPVEMKASFYIYTIAFLYVEIDRVFVRALFLLLQIYIGVFYYTEFLPFIIGFTLCVLDNAGVVKLIRSKRIFEYLLSAYLFNLAYNAYIDPGRIELLSIIYLKTSKFSSATASEIWVGSLILTFFHISGFAQLIFSTHILRWLGKISFGLYLCHGLFLPLGGVAIAHYEQNGYIVADSLLSSLVYIFLPAGLLSGWLFYHLVDKPATKLVQKVFNNGIIMTLEGLILTQICLKALRAIFRLCTRLFFERRGSYESIPNVKIEEA
jgi:peptidoglycan/LPS O-acetylase OafA/YrhL